MTAPAAPQALSDDKERAAFEAWAKPRLFSLRRIEDSPDQYDSLTSECGWMAWQARAVLAAAPAPLLREALDAVERSEQYGAGSWPTLTAKLRAALGEKA